jgi:hypothetical protein
MPAIDPPRWLTACNSLTGRQILAPINLQYLSSPIVYYSRWTRR